MGLWRRLFSSSSRKARRAEAEGRYREAAAAYAEAGRGEEAARALLFEAARASGPEVRRQALLDALRWLKEDDPKRQDVEGQLGDVELLRAQSDGVHTAEERRRLEQAAKQLELAGQGGRAATAWELLGRTDEAVRCLEQAGEVERLEALLDSQGEQDGEVRALREALRDHDAALGSGARLEALTALKRGLSELPEAPELLRARASLEAKMFHRPALTLRFLSRRVRLAGELPVELGREGVFPVRGPGISRRHASLDRAQDKLLVSDLDSRNGTWVDGLLLESRVELGGGARVGLGEDVHLRVSLEGQGWLAVEVLDGIDRGLRGFAGKGELSLPDLPARFAFPGGYPTLTPAPGSGSKLGDREVVTPIELLVGDVLELGGVRVEVEP